MNEEKIHYYLEYAIGVLLVILLVGGGIGYKNIMDNKSNEIINNDTEDILDTSGEEEIEVGESNDLEITDEEVKYHVDVKGAVKNSGVYELSKGSMVIDAINMAGGLNSNASTQYVNLAYPINDSMVIYIYTKNEVKNMTNPSTSVCNCPTVDTSSCQESSIIVNSSENNSSGSIVDNNVTSDSGENSSKISINTGTLEELMSLSGIGEAKAKAIIEYRTTNGLFQKIEDIMNVSGIGESAYQKIKDYITL